MKEEQNHQKESEQLGFQYETTKDITNQKAKELGEKNFFKSKKYLIIISPNPITYFISSLKGASDEVRKKGNLKYDRLKESVDKEGFDPERSEILIEVNHKGEAYIVEGNTRVTLAKELGVPNIKAEIRYKNGAELVDGRFSPQNI